MSKENCGKKAWVKKNIWSTNNLGPKKKLVAKNLGSKEIFVPINCWTKILLVQEKFGSNEILGPKIWCLWGNLQKKTVYLKTLSKWEGGRSTPLKKIEKKCFFDKSWKGKGLQNLLSKIETLYFVSYFLYPWPSENDRDNSKCRFQSLKFHDFCQKF